MGVLRGSQRDVVYLETNSALVYEPNCGVGGCVGLSQWVQLCTWSPNTPCRSNSIFNLWEGCPVKLFICWVSCLLTANYWAMRHPFPLYWNTADHVKVLLRFSFEQSLICEGQINELRIVFFISWEPWNAGPCLLCVTVDGVLTM